MIVSDLPHILETTSVDTDEKELATAYKKQDNGKNVLLIIPIPYSS